MAYFPFISVFYDIVSFIECISNDGVKKLF